MYKLSLQNQQRQTLSNFKTQAPQSQNFVVGGCQTPINVNHVYNNDANRPADTCSILSQTETVHDQAVIFKQHLRSESDPTIYHVERSDDSVELQSSKQSCQLSEKYSDVPETSTGAKPLGNAVGFLCAANLAQLDSQLRMKDMKKREKKREEKRKVKVVQQYKKLCKYQEQTASPSVSSSDNMDAKTRRCSKPDIYDAILPILPINLKTNNSDSDPLSATQHRMTPKMTMAMTQQWRGLSLE